MNRHAVNAFLSEIRWQSQIAVWSFHGLRSEIGQRKKCFAELTAFVEGKPEQLPPADKQRVEALYEQFSANTIRTLMHLQSILASTGIIAEIFWPNETHGTAAEIRARARRARILKARTKTLDDSPLRFRAGHFDDTRGGLLHVDEMIDRALAMSGSQRVERFFLGSVASMQEDETWKRSDAVRALDDETLVLSVLARESDLIALEQEAKRLHSNLHKGVRLTVVHRPTSHEGADRVAVSFGTADLAFDELAEKD